MSDPQWFYADGAGVRHGPVAASTLHDAFAQGQLGADDMVWREGMADWQRHADVAELNTGGTTVPPPLVRAPASVVHPAADIAYAGFWRRYLALVLDGVILWVPIVVLMVVVAIAWPADGASGDDGSMLTVLVYLVYFAASPLYFALQESSAAQATLGKRALGIKVTNLAGGRLSFGHALGRWFAAALSYITLYIGFVMAAFTQRRQALHDMVASTLVVDRWAFTPHPERQRKGLSGWMIAMVLVFFLGIPVLGILAAIAIPAYQDYTVRAKLHQAIATAAPTKSLVADFAASQSRCPDNGEGGLAASDSAWGPYTRSLIVGTMQNGNCGIEITTASTGTADIDGKRIWLELQPDRRQWVCNSEIADKYLPADCRG